MSYTRTQPEARVLYAEHSIPAAHPVLPPSNSCLLVQPPGSVRPHDQGLLTVAAFPRFWDELRLN